jgi:hypothetical protein
MSSGNLGLADLAVSLSYDVVDFASDIAFKAAYGFELGVSLAYALIDIGLCTRLGS